MQPQIQIEEPFRKSWSQPQVIVTREDIIHYENSQEQTCTQQREQNNIKKSEPQSMTISWNSDDCRESKEMLQKRLMDLRNSLLQSQIVNLQLRTPEKHCDNTHDTCLVFQPDITATNSTVCDRIIPHHSMSRSDVLTTNSQVCDQIIPHHSKSRSLPSSPQNPNMMSSPTIPITHDRHFNFIPERLRFLEETRQLTENDEVDNGLRLPQGHCRSPQGSSRWYNDLHHMYSLSPETGRTIDSLYYKNENLITETQPLRTKRKLNMDDPYSTSAKQAKSDVSQDAEHRYVDQLEMDLIALKHRIHSPSPENVTRKTICACIEMEKHFMEMATSAYKSIRRYDGTMHSFEQFKEELTQTNEVIKDSMELLQNVRQLCVH